MIPSGGVTIFKTDQSPYMVVSERKALDGKPHFPQMWMDENDPINYYTIEGRSIRMLLIGIPKIGNELVVQVYTTLDRAIEYVSSLEVLQ
jgi:hypothetical protein